MVARQVQCGFVSCRASRLSSPTEHAQDVCDKGSASLKEFGPVMFAGEGFGGDFTQNSNSGEGSDTDVQNVRCTWVLRRKTNRTIRWLIPSDVTPRITGAQQLYQVKRMIYGIGNVLFRTCSQSSNE